MYCKFVWYEITAWHKVTHSSYNILFKLSKRLTVDKVLLLNLKYNSYKINIDIKTTYTKLSILRTQGAHANP